ncbi:hypothetical protein GKE82_24375 [Conexibacter sp. W3-3-2]|uniref:hypothetical protein n=1 Tax=Conexibacter sp. W3-3-2 TaxID=2675227 RepID=UPI0012B9BE4B|nr:hypothetical protein [Conexibacter sp. W3-3-2]MTD47346.1 hypothetical protein [Conexibacter sp. W3-3-2]
MFLVLGAVSVAPLIDWSAALDRGTDAARMLQNPFISSALVFLLVLVLRWLFRDPDPSLGTDTGPEIGEARHERTPGTGGCETKTDSSAPPEADQPKTLVLRLRGRLRSLSERLELRRCRLVYSLAGRFLL